MIIYDSKTAYFCLYLRKNGSWHYIGKHRDFASLREIRNLLINKVLESEVPANNKVK